MGVFLTWWRRPKLWRGCGEFFGDDELSVSKFRSVPQLCGGGDFGHYSKPPPPNGSCAQAAVDIAVTDQCGHLFICLAKMLDLCHVPSMASCS